MRDGYFQGSALPDAKCPTVNGGGYDCPDCHHGELSNAHSTTGVDAYACSNCHCKFLHIGRRWFYKK